MPILEHKTTSMAHERRHGLRWAHERWHSARSPAHLNGACRQRLSKAARLRPPGARAGGSQPPPARFISQTIHHSERNNLEHPPQWHVRLILEPRSDRGSRLSFEWIANGFTAICFWTVPRRLIAALESRARSWITGMAPLASIESK
jgi:hypothetical protein